MACDTNSFWCGLSSGDETLVFVWFSTEDDPTSGRNGDATLLHAMGQDQIVVGFHCIVSELILTRAQAAQEEQQHHEPSRVVDRRAWVASIEACVIVPPGVGAGHAFGVPCSELLRRW